MNGGKLPKIKEKYCRTSFFKKTKGEFDVKFPSVSARAHTHV